MGRMYRMNKVPVSYRIGGVSTNEITHEGAQLLFARNLIRHSLHR